MTNLLSVCGRQIAEIVKKSENQFTVIPAQASAGVTGLEFFDDGQHSAY
jgi:hypothetical protein